MSSPKKECKGRTAVAFDAAVSLLLIFITTFVLFTLSQSLPLSLQPRYTEQSFRRDALNGLERCAGELVSDMVALVESEEDPEEGQVGG